METELKVRIVYPSDVRGLSPSEIMKEYGPLVFVHEDRGPQEMAGYLAYQVGTIAVRGLTYLPIKNDEQARQRRLNEMIRLRRRIATELIERAAQIMLEGEVSVEWIPPRSTSENGT